MESVKKFLCVAVFAIFGIKLTKLLAAAGNGSLKVTSFAVGKATFIGTSKTYESFAVLAPVAVMTLVAFALGYFSKKSAAEFAGEQAEALNERNRREIPFLIAGFAVAVFFFLCPDIQSGAYAINVGDINVNWDGANLFLWSYDLHHLMVPFKDFWFPYGGQLFTLSPFPFGLFLWSIETTILTLSLMMAFWHLMPRYRSAGTLVALAIGIWNLPTSLRYLFPVVIVLLFVSLLKKRQSLEKLTSVCLGLAIGTSFFIEPNQVVAATLGLGVISAIYFFHDRRAFAQRIPMLVLGLGIGLAGILGTVWLVYSVGALPDALKFYSAKEFGGLATYAAHPIDFIYWTPHWGRKPEPEFFVFLFYGALAIIAAFEIARLLRKSVRDITPLLVIVGTFVAVTPHFGKQLMRPHIALQIFYPPLVAIAVYLILKVRVNSRWATQSKVAIVLIAFGLLNAIYPFRNAGVSMARSVSALSHIPESSRLVLADIQGRDNEKKDAFFDEGVAGVVAAHPKLVDRLRSLRKSQSDEPYFYNLGDESWLYVATRTKAARYITYFNGATVTGQQESIGFVQSIALPYVVFNPKKKIFDDVPNVVRTPLLFQYIIDNYEPMETVEGFQILSRNEANQTPISFWVDNLGSEIDLGYIFEASDINQGKTPESCATTGCVPALRVSVTDTQKPIRIEARIGAASKIKIQARFKDAKEYLLRLDHLWFYKKYCSPASACRFFDDGSQVELVPSAYQIDPLTLY